MIRVEVNDTAVRALLARARAAAANPEPVLRAAGTTLLALILGTFSAHGAGFRPAPWPPNAVRPFLNELASRLTEALRNEAGRCNSLG